MAQIVSIVNCSLSSHKLQAVYLAWKQEFGTAPLYGLVPREVASGVNAMPDGDEETLRGAYNRAYAALAEDQESGYSTVQKLYLAEEGGVRVVDDGQMRRAFAMAYVVGFYEDARSPIIIPTIGIEFPVEIYDEAKRRGFRTTTIGHIVQERMGGEHTDPYAPLTNGVITRTQTFVEAIAYVLRMVANR